MSKVQQETELIRNSSFLSRSLVPLLTNLVGFTAMVADADRELSPRYSVNETGRIKGIASMKLCMQNLGSSPQLLLPWECCGVVRV